MTFMLVRECSKLERTPIRPVSLCLSKHTVVSARVAISLKCFNTGPVPSLSSICFYSFSPSLSPPEITGDKHNTLSSGVTQLSLFSSSLLYIFPSVPLSLTFFPTFSLYTFLFPSLSDTNPL